MTSIKLGAQQARKNPRAARIAATMARRPTRTAQIVQLARRMQKVASQSSVRGRTRRLGERVGRRDRGLFDEAVALAVEIGDAYREAEQKARRRGMLERIAVGVLVAGSGAYAANRWLR